MKLLTPSLFHYKRRYLRHDIMAAIIVTAVTIPQSLAFAVIIGLPPVTGLYTAFIAPIVFALLANTRKLVVGADSATAAVLASGAALAAQAGTAGHANAVLIIGAMTAIILVIMSVLRFGFLADLLSRPVLIGFLAGVGVQLVVSSLSVMMGVEASGTTWQRLGEIAGQLGSVNSMTLTVSVLVVGIILVLRRTIIPGELAGLVFAVLFALVFQVGHFGVKMVGALPTSLPEFTLPVVSFEQIIILAPAAISIALVILAQSSLVIRSSERNHEKTKINSDLFALGIANAVTSLLQGFTVNGSPSRTQASLAVGGKSQMVNVFTSGLVLLVLVTSASLFQYVPHAALSSIVCVIGIYLIRFNEIAHLWRRHRMECMVAIVALLGTVLFGVLQGVFIAVIVSLAERLSRQYHPRDAVLLRDGEVSDWLLDRVGDDRLQTKTTKGLLVYSFDGSLFFENIYYFEHRLRRAMRHAEQPVSRIIIDAAAIDDIDYTAAEELKVFFEQLSAEAVVIHFSHVSPYLNQQIQELGITDVIGHDSLFPTLKNALAHMFHQTIKKE